MTNQNPKIHYRDLLIYSLFGAALLIILFAVLDYVLSIAYDKTAFSYRLNAFNENEGMMIAFVLPCICLILSIIIGVPYIFPTKKSHIQKAPSCIAEQSIEPQEAEKGDDETRPKGEEKIAFCANKQSFWYGLVGRRLLSFSKIPRVKLVQRLACLMWIIFSIGWVLFFVAWCVNCHDNGSVDTPLGALLFSASSALNMFMLNINDNLIDNISSHSLLKTAIILTFLVAFMSTMLLVLSLIFSRFISNAHSRFLKPKNNADNNLYVFFGTNEPSRLLARDIKASDKNSLILFVECPEVSEADDDNSWSSIINFFTQRKEVFASVDQDEQEGLLIANQRIEDIENVDLELWKHLGLKKIQQLLDNDLIKGVHFFFMTNDRDQNVAATIKLSEYLNLKVSADAIEAKKKSKSKDQEPKTKGENKAKEVTDSEGETQSKEEPGPEGASLAEEFAQPKDGSKLNKEKIEDESKREYKVYCLARLDGVSQTIQEFLPQQKIFVFVIDNSNLSVEQLRRDSSNHPIRFVDVDLANNPGTVTSDFHSLVIGFGETGRDTVKFLYEFGAFPTSDSDPRRKTYRAKFDCKVVEPNCSELSGKFKASRPAIFSESKDDNTGTVTFHPVDASSEDFYTQILTREYINKLNYVVVSAGDEEKNLSIALDILRYAVKYRKDLEKFKILVRVYNGEKVWYFDKIIQHYNVSLRPKYKLQTPVIAIFGDNKSIYRYNIIVNDSLKDEAIEYAASYERIRTKNPNYKSSEEREQWSNKRNDAFTQCVGQMEKLGKYRRQMSQNLSNALHKDTKLHIIRLVIQEMIRRSFIEDGVAEPEVTGHDIDKYLLNIYERMFADDVNTLKTGVGCKDEIIYPNLNDKEMQLMTNLALLEHMRWNASHEMLGYAGAKIKKADDLHLLHNCLFGWEVIDDISERDGWKDDYKNYDFLVVETSLGLWRKDMLKQDKVKK